MSENVIEEGNCADLLAGRFASDEYAFPDAGGSCASKYAGPLLSVKSADKIHVESREAITAIE